MQRYQPLVVVLVAVVSGIVADRQAALPAPAWWCLAAGGWLAWLAAVRLHRPHASCAGLVLCLLALAAAWHHLRWHMFADDEIGLYARPEPAAACVEAIVTRGPRRVPAPPRDPLNAIPRGDSSRLVVHLVALRDGRRWLAASGAARLLVDGHVLGIHAGDRLRIFCQLSAPTAAQNPGEFDFARHARGDRQLCLLSASSPDCLVVRRPAGSLNLTQAFDEVRSRGDGLLWDRLAHERSGLAAALLLGAREQLGDETTQAFTRTGTVHLLSISGLHVALLAGSLFWIMRLGLVPRGAALMAVALVILLYAAVIDAEPPAVRATILVLLACVSLEGGRRLLPFNALSAAALCVLAWNPADLFRVGPQLSFLAVGTLAWFGPAATRRPIEDPLERLIYQTRSWPDRAVRRFGWWLRQALWLTLCVWGTSLPLVMAHFHLLSPATLVLTPVLALPVTVGLTSGFAILVFGWLAPPLGLLFGWICDWSLWSLEGMVGVASRAPLSHFWVAGPEPWWLAGFYSALAILALLGHRGPRRRWCLALLAAWSAVGLATATFPRLDATRLECAFLSVGHGCAAVVELPDGRSLLYDAGRLGSPAAGARSISGYLWSRGITHLDAVVVSHADVDHFNALPELLEKFSVGVVYVSPAMLRDQGEAVALLRRAIHRAGVPLRTIWAGDRLRVGNDCRMEVLHPLQRGVMGSDNANSLVLALEYVGRRILLTGDLESPMSG